MARRLNFLLAVLFALAFANPAAAASVLVAPEEQSEPEPAPAATGAIDATSETGADDRIAQRITGIFGAVPALSEVTVTVKEGVVSLGGKAATPDDIDRAEQIASRVSGVVTIENEIERDLSVGESIESLGGLSHRISELVKMLPLIGAALLVAFAIGLLGYLIASFSWLWNRLAPNFFLAELIASAVRFFFVVGGIVVALQMLGAGALLGAVLGGAGIVGIALGFAMRDTIENYVASILLSVRQPFRANDWVMIDQYEGRVIRLTSRATILMTLDGNHLRIPNGMVFKAVILNYTRNPQRRFEFELGIDAEDDPTAARQLGIDVLSKLDFVLDEPPPAARLENVGDSNIVLKFLAWIDQEHTDWYKAHSEAVPAVKSALEDAGFSLPEPIYRLRFDAGTPLPMQQVAHGEAAPPAPPVPSKPATATVTVEEAPDDMRPVDEIAEMVESERSDTRANAKDLLDPHRPVE